MWGSAAECDLRLIERQLYSVARLGPHRVSCCFIDVMLLFAMYVLFNVNSKSNHCYSAIFLLLLPEYDIPKLQPQPIHWNLEYEGVERNCKVFPADPGSNVELPSKHCV